MVINCLCNAKRFQATVGFIADRDTTDLLELTSCASAQVHPVIPPDELLSAENLGKRNP
jgi:hypothetical protein